MLEAEIMSILRNISSWCDEKLEILFPILLFVLLTICIIVALLFGVALILEIL